MQRNKVILIIVGVFLIVSVVLITLGWGDMKKVLAEAMWPATIGAFALSLISDFWLSYAYVIVSHTFSIEIKSSDLLEIGFVSSALNNIMALFGAAAHSMRVIMIRQRGIQSGGIVSASLFHSYVNNVMMLVLFDVGLVSLVMDNKVQGTGQSFVIIGAILILILLFITTAMFAVRKLRMLVLNTVRKLWRLIVHRDITNFMNDLDGALTNALIIFRKKRFLLAMIIVLMAAEWAFSAGSLWFCFLALGKAPSVSTLLAGFSIGISAGNISMIPGGLGVQEASMAGVFALLGVPLAQAALVVILFRIANNFIPFFISLPLYVHIARRHAKPT
jgi:glycosyltransferase 2 family protein